MRIHYNNITMNGLCYLTKNYYLLMEIRNKINVDDSTNNSIFKQQDSSKETRGITKLGSINMPLQF